MLFSCQKKKILLCRSHACVTSHKFALENSKIVTTNLRYERRCLEGWHINNFHALLNRDDGAWFVLFYSIFPLTSVLMNIELSTLAVFLLNISI